MLINSIFNSIDGEVNYFGQGMLTTFIRLQGCNLKCGYCDTKQAQDKTKAPFKMTPTEVFKKVKELGGTKVTITGGEPLEQRKDLLRLVEMFNRNFGWDFRVSIETNGSKSLHNISSMASWVVDYKVTSSGMNRFMDSNAFAFLGKEDIVKFVIEDKLDFDDALAFMKTMWGLSYSDKDEFPIFAFSPVFQLLEPAQLYEWINKSPMLKYYKTALNIQLHKILSLP
jgi:7-carboxy-7-deazaguanine synthase